MSFTYINIYYKATQGDCRGRDCMIVVFTTTCAISAYHH